MQFGSCVQWLYLSGYQQWISLLISTTKHAPLSINESHIVYIILMYYLASILTHFIGCIQVLSLQLLALRYRIIRQL